MSKTDAAPAYLSEFAQDIYNGAKDRESGYKSQFAREMQKSETVKREIKNSLCDNKATIDRRKNSHTGWAHCFPAEGSKYRQDLNSKSGKSLKSAMSSTPMISKVETVLSLTNNSQEYEKQSIKISRKIDEQIVIKVSELNHHQSDSRGQMYSRTPVFTSDESSCNSSDSGHCTDRGYTDDDSLDNGREDVGWKPSSKVSMLGNIKQQKSQAIEHRREEHKVTIRIKSLDTAGTVLPRHTHLSNPISQSLHSRRISTTSQGTVIVPVPFVPSRGLECFHMVY